jgi:osmotically-inducible protein OsmY
MYLYKLTKLLIISVTFILGGCVTVLDATTDSTIEPDSGKRSFGRYIDDENLETILSVNLRKTGPALANAHINVTCFNGIVLLTGEVQGDKFKTLAGETVRSNESVRQVHNQLLVKSNSTLYSRTNDGWIATKVRTKIVNDESIEADRVKVITENRIVYLMGLLTHQEAKTVSNLAASIKGVEQVVRVIEYIER